MDGEMSYHTAARVQEHGDIISSRKLEVMSFDLASARWPSEQVGSRDR